MAEQSWHAARLIPTSGIRGADEQERRATSALLAVMSAVREFGRALLSPLGAPSGSLETYIEVPFTLDERKVTPDGLIRAVRGKRAWTALVEVKTGDNALAPGQLEAYLDVAREQGFDALITISNEIPPAAGVHPTVVDKRKLKKVALHHWPWSQVLTEAVVQKEHRGVSDPDQAWILGELIRYLEHPRSGALEFESMGSSWVPVREAIVAGTLRNSTKGAVEVVQRFDALLRHVGLRLGRQLGTDVTLVSSRKESADPSLRSAALIQQLTERGSLTGALRIPDTVGPLVVTADIRAGQVTCHIDVDAPREGRPTTRVNWLLRQLRAAPDDARIESFALHSRGASAAELIRDARTNPNLLAPDRGKEIKSFRVACTSKLGSKGSAGRSSFIDSITDAVDGFYETVVQNLKAWSAAPPRLRSEEREITVQENVPVALVSTAMSSQDEAEEAPTAPDPVVTGDGTPTRPGGESEDHPSGERASL